MLADESLLREFTGEKGANVVTESANCRDRSGRIAPSFSRWKPFITALVTGFVSITAAYGQVGDPVEAPDVGANAVPIARRIRVSLPITGSEDRTIKQIVQRTLDESRGNGARPTVVLEFVPPRNSEGAGSEFERCLSIARFLTSSATERVRTVAYIPKAAVGHSVLVAIACEQIIMAPDAVIGDAGQGEEAIGPTIRGGYTEIARSRLTVPDGIALGMLDRDLEISRVTTDNGVIYTWPDELQRLRETRNDLREISTLIPAGKPGKFRGDELRDMGFVSYLASDIEEVAARLKIPPGRLEYDPSFDGSWRAIRVALSGPVNAGSVERILRTIDQQRDQGSVNFVCLQIDSPGGDLLESVRLANYLAGLDASRIRTVAFVRREARADAMIPAWACDHLVAHPDAILGGNGAASFDESELLDLRPTLEELAKRKAKTWSIVGAMLDPRIEVFRYTQQGTDRVEYLSEDEASERWQSDRGEAVEGFIDQGAWVKGDVITPTDQVLQAVGREAEAWGLVRFLAEDLSEFETLYGLPGPPELIGPNWAFDVIDALASPQLAGLLLFIGGFALIAELSSPGIGIGGFLSAVCFVLYFWANFLHGTAEVLEVMLFLTGVACVIVEVFLIPGFGIFGLGGAALIVSSLVLATQTFVLPTNDYQLRQLSQSMMIVTFAGAGVFVCLIFFRRYVQHVPFFGRIMLVPPQDDDLHELTRRESLVHYDYLLGQVGTTRTQLTPSGKAIFGDTVVDVIADGEVIERGENVEVVEVNGNRVVVRSAQAS